MNGDLCEQFAVMFDTSNLSTWGSTKLKKGGCHELGHTTGLKHADGKHNILGCMWQNIGHSKMRSYLSSADKSHVNGRY